MSDQAVITEPLSVEVSEDHLHLVVKNATGQADIKVEDLRKAILAAKIPLSPTIEEKIKGITKEGGIFACGEQLDLQVGVAPVDDQQARVELLAEKKVEGSGNIDFYSQCGLHIVSTGQEIGRVLPYVKGRDGVSVHGRALPRNVLPVDKVSMGKNVELAADGKTVVAKAAGVVHVEGLKIWIEPRLAIEKDVDFSTGNVSFEGDVTIGGNVLDLFHVKATGGITVLGTVEAATVEATKDLIVYSGIAGKEKGKFSAGGNVVAKFISNAQVEAGGGVVVKRELNNARVICHHELVVETGAIMGGHVTARGGIKCVALGSPSAVKTLVEVGMDEGLRQFAQTEIPQIEADRKVIARIRVELAPLLQQARTLKPEQKEKITEMMYEADIKDKALEEKLKIWRQRLQAMEALATVGIVVKEKIFPGVVVHVADLEAKIDKEIDGPVKILLRRFPDGWRIIALNQLTSSVKVLGAHIYADPAFEKAKLVLTPPSEKGK